MSKFRGSRPPSFQPRYVCKKIDDGTMATNISIQEIKWLQDGPEHWSEYSACVSSSIREDFGMKLISILEKEALLWPT